MKAPQSNSIKKTIRAIDHQTFQEVVVPYRENE